MLKVLRAQCWPPVMYHTPLTTDRHPFTRLPVDQVRGVVLVNAAGKFEEVKAAVEAPLEAALQGAERDAAQPPLREVWHFHKAPKL